jgi:hypothetical protein
LEDYVMDLYLDTTPPPVEKVAAEAKLSDSADSWPREVLKELLHQHPYLGSYEINPVMQRVDGEQGYGTGFFLVHNRSEQPVLGGGTKAQVASQGVKFTRIPIIIRSTKLQPLDIFLTPQGDTQPLTDERVRASLFRPQVFDSIKKSPGDAPMAEQLYPPTSRQHAMTGGQVIDANMTSQTKTSSVKPKFLMQAIKETISSADILAVSGELQKNAHLARSLASNKAAKPFLQFLGGLEPASATEVEKTAVASVMPDVIQIERDGERYIYKEAASSEFDPEVAESDRHTLAEQAGEDLVAAVDRTGAATISTNPVVHNNLEDEEISPIDYFGQYKVKTKDGREIMGWVFPTVLDFDGTELPWKIFSNGSQANVQAEMVGSFAGKSTNVIQGKPEGYGFFFHVTSTGSVIALHPVEIQGRSGDGYMAESMMGDPITITFNSDVRAPTRIGEGAVVLPSTMRWSPLGKERVQLIDNAADFLKTSMVKGASSQVRIISDKMTWSFSGPPIEKVAHRWREQLHAGDAMFVACSLGLHPDFATNTLVKAAQEGSVMVHGCRPLGTRKEKLATAREEVLELMRLIPRGGHLLKEAAALEDVTTVDRVLSLGFLNPENVQTFIHWLPDLEESLSKLAGILLAVRLGLEDLPEDTVKSAMERLDEVVSGLKKLVFRQKKSPTA